MSVRDTHRQLLDRLYPLGDVDGKKGDLVEYHWLGVLLVLAVRSDLFDATFPYLKPADLTALKASNLGLDFSRLDDAKILRLEDEREALAGLQRAWFNVAGYEDPPCPDDVRLAKLVAITKAL